MEFKSEYYNETQIDSFIISYGFKEGIISEKNIIEIFKDADLIIKFIDFKLSENKFVRIIENKKYYFENNKQILFSKENNSKFIRVLPKSNINSFKIYFN